MGNENSKGAAESLGVLENPGKLELSEKDFDLIDDIQSLQSILSEHSTTISDKENRMEITSDNSRRSSAGWIEKIKRFDDLASEMTKLKAKYEKVQSDKCALREVIGNIRSEASDETEKSHQRLSGLLGEFKKVSFYYSL